MHTVCVYIVTGCTLKAGPCVRCEAKKVKFVTACTLEDTSAADSRDMHEAIESK